MTDSADSEAQARATPIQVLPATGTQRALFAIVIILGVLIVLALGALVGGFLTGGGKGSGGEKPWTYQLDVPAGSRITSTYLDGNRIVVHLSAHDSEDVVLLEANSGRVLGRLHVKPAQ